VKSLCAFSLFLPSRPRSPLPRVTGRRSFPCRDRQTPSCLVFSPRKVTKFFFLAEDSRPSPPTEGPSLGGENGLSPRSESFFLFPSFFSFSRERGRSRFLSVWWSEMRRRKVDGGSFFFFPLLIDKGRSIFSEGNECLALFFFFFYLSFLRGRQRIPCFFSPSFRDKSATRFFFFFSPRVPDVAAARIDRRAAFYLFFFLLDIGHRGLPHASLSSTAESVFFLSSRCAPVRTVEKALLCSPLFSSLSTRAVRRCAISPLSLSLESETGQFERDGRHQRRAFFDGFSFFPFSIPRWSRRRPPLPFPFFSSGGAADDDAPFSSWKNWHAWGEEHYFYRLSYGDAGRVLAFFFSLTRKEEIFGFFRCRRRAGNRDSRRPGRFSPASDPPQGTSPRPV